MSKESFQCWLLIRDVDPKTWYRTAGPSLVASHGGTPIEDVYAPGLLLSFSKVSDAARAALRCFTDVRRGLPGGIMPTIVIDIKRDAKRMATVLYSVKSEFIILTEEAARLLVGDPVELLPGPLVPLDGGDQVVTHMLPTSSHNLGWALPSVPLAGVVPVATYPEAPVYSRKTEPAVINIQMGKERSSFRLPWKLFVFSGILLGGFLVLVSVARLIVPKSFFQSEGDSDATSNASTESSPESESILNQIDLSPKETVTPLPLGFGTLVIETDPKECQIFLNDRLVGKKSPLVLEKKSNQLTYKLMVKKKGYDPYMNIFNVEADERKVIEVRLAKNVPKGW